MTTTSRLFRMMMMLMLRSREVNGARSKRRCRRHRAQWKQRGLPPRCLSGRTGPLTENLSMTRLSHRRTRWRRRSSGTWPPRTAMKNGMEAAKATLISALGEKERETQLVATKVAGNTTIRGGPSAGVSGKGY